MVKIQSLPCVRFGSGGGLIQQRTGSVVYPPAAEGPVAYPEVVERVSFVARVVDQAVAPIVSLREGHPQLGVDKLHELPSIMHRLRQQLNEKHISTKKYMYEYRFIYINYPSYVYNSSYVGNEPDALEVILSFVGNVRKYGPFGTSK